MVGTTTGELHLFAGTEHIYEAQDLGQITCVGVGDVRNCGKVRIISVGFVHLSPNHTTNTIVPVLTKCNASHCAYAVTLPYYGVTEQYCCCQFQWGVLHI